MGIIKKTKGHPLATAKERPFLHRNGKLDYSDIYSGRTFLSLLYVKGNSIAFIEAFKTACVDC